MRSILEKAIVHLLNGDQDKAETLFHKFMVEKARQIHESLRQGEDVELKENWDSEISEEEYFDDTDLEGEGDDAEGATDDVPAMGDEVPDETMGDDSLGDVGDEGDLGDDLGDDDLGGEIEGEGGGLEGKIDNLEGKIDELTAEFDRLMSKMDSDEAGDDFGDEGLGDDLGSEDEGIEDLGDGAAEDDLGGEDEFGSSDMGGEDTGDIASRMDRDMGDEEQPEHEMAEDTDMLEDITESVLAELDKIAAPANSEGKEIGSGGKTGGGNTDSILPNHPVDQRWQQAKPVMVKAQGDAHNDSFERETPPSNKTVTKRRNNDAGVKKLTGVPKGGDSSALINKDFAGGHPATKSITAGKSSTK